MPRRSAPGREPVHAQRSDRRSKMPYGPERVGMPSRSGSHRRMLNAARQGGLDEDCPPAFNTARGRARNLE